MFGKKNSEVLEIEEKKSKTETAIGIIEFIVTLFSAVGTILSAIHNVKKDN